MRKIAALLLALVIAPPLFAANEWYEEYASGVAACNAGAYGTCIKRMKTAVTQKPASAFRARTFGMNFVDYTPFYYLGLAYLNQGNLKAANENFTREADAGVIYRTANSGNFSVMSREATRLLTDGGDSGSFTAMSSPVSTAQSAPAPSLDANENALRRRIEALEAAQRRSEARIAELEHRLDACEARSSHPPSN